MPEAAGGRGLSVSRKLQPKESGTSMTQRETFHPLCTQCGQSLKEVGVASSVVTSGTSNLEVIACGACSKVFGAFPGPLIPLAGDSR